MEAGRFLLVVMLAACVLFVSGCAGIDDAAASEHADTTSSETEDRAEGDVAAVAATSPPPAPTKSTGELTDAERLFQGVWQLNLYKDDSRVGSLRIEDRDFHADGVHGEYTGYVSIRTDASPPQIDFTIEECEGDHKGQTSTGIYYVEDDGAIVFAGPAPGDPRPSGFTEPNEMWRMRPSDAATEEDAETPG